MVGRPKSREGRYERITLEVREDLLRWLDDQSESRREVIEEALTDVKTKKERDTMATITKLRALLEKFLESDDFKYGVISATKEDAGGSGYSVELFPEGSAWRVLWNNEIGNKYDSPGVILALPKVNDEEEYQDAVHGENPMSEEDYFDLCFANSEYELKAEMREQIQ